jgi:hypothetical protein
MNERIRELINESTSFKEGDTEGKYDIEVFDKQKFAELIVKKCIKQASIGNGHGNNQWDRALTFAAKNIKQHFGVEE